MQSAKTIFGIILSFVTIATAAQDFNLPQQNDRWTIQSDGSIE
jgi:hypothetical protein